MRWILLLATASLMTGCGSKPDPDAVTLNMREVGASEPSPVYPRPDATVNEAEEDEPETATITVEKWSAPDLEHVRYTQVEDQTGCRWWMPFPGSEDEDGPDPVLGKDHRPMCRDKSQEPDAEILDMDEDEALKEIAAGTAVRASKAALERRENGDDPEQEESISPAPDPTPTPSPTPSRTTSTAGQPLLTTRGRMATSMGNGLAMTHDGRLAIQMGGMAVPTRR